MRKYLLMPAVLISVTFVDSQKSKKAYELVSPNEQYKIKFELVKILLYYTMFHGKTEVITLSDMCFILKGNEKLSTDFEMKNVKTIHSMRLGKRVGEKKNIRNNYNQLSFRLQQKKVTNANSKFNSALLMTESFQVCVSKTKRKRQYFHYG